MSEKRLNIPPDAWFAFRLDRRCEACQNGDSALEQQAALLERAHKTINEATVESRAAQALVDRCQRCAAGNDLPRVVSVQFSCSWRITKK